MHPNRGASEILREFADRRSGGDERRRFDSNSLRARIDLFRKFAWDEHHRRIQVWTNSYIFQGETENEARDCSGDCVFEKGDWPGAENLINLLCINSQLISAVALTKLNEHFMAC